MEAKTKAHNVRKQGSGNSSGREYYYDEEDDSAGKQREADAEVVRSDLAIKNYVSEDIADRKRAQKDKGRDGRRRGTPKGQRSRSQEGNQIAQKKGLLNRMFGKLSKNEQR